MDWVSKSKNEDSFQENGYERYKYIDVMRGIGILLVVFAHIHAANQIGINGIIYSFHMPLFFSFPDSFTRRQQESFGSFY